MQIPTPASSAKTFRTAARRALAGRWSDALTWLAVLTLICGGLFGAGFTFNQAEDTVVGCIGLTQQAASVAVGDISLGNFKSSVRHNGLFNQVLNFINS